ncbi:antirestriction protein [Citrobacter braakii]|uniref:antirestriction protein n=1 Tax=Citrobacter braakii TaxID=57706 RepID=UPI00374E6F2A
MDTQHPQFAQQTAITASVVPDELRIDFWPQHFGSIPQWITLEPRIFAWMDRFCDEYCGGIWSFYTLSNGGAFMAPEPDGEKWTLFNPMNGNDAEMSGEAAGIAVCLMAYSHHVCRTLNPAPFCALLIKDTHDGTVTYPTGYGTSIGRTTHSKTRLNAA